MSRNRKTAKSEPVSRRVEFRRDYRRARARFLGKLALFFAGLIGMVGLAIWLLLSLEQSVPILSVNVNNPKSVWQLSTNPVRPIDASATTTSLFFVRDAEGQVKVSETEPQRSPKFAGWDGTMILFSELKSAVQRGATPRGVVAVPPDQSVAAENRSSINPVQQLFADEGGQQQEWVPFEDVLEAVLDYGSEKSLTLFPVNFSKRKHLIFVCDVADYQPIAGLPELTDGFVKHARECWEQKVSAWREAGRLDGIDVFLWLSHRDGQRSNLMGQSVGFRSVFRQYFEEGVVSRADEEGNRNGTIEYRELEAYVCEKVASEANNLKTLQNPLCLASTEQERDFAIKKVTRQEGQTSLPFRPLARQPVDSLDRQWQRLEEGKRWLIWEAPTEFQRAVAMLIRMERIWHQGLASQSEQDAYRNEEFSTLQQEVERILNAVADRHPPRSPYAPAIDAGGFQLSSKAEFCVSLWEARYDLLANGGGEAFDLGVLTPLDTQAILDGLPADLDAGERQSQGASLVAKRQQERVERILAEWQKAQASQQLPIRIWRALIDPAQKSYLTQSTWEALFEGTPTADGLVGGLKGKTVNPANGLPWTELAFVTRMREELDWAFYAQPNRLIENQELLQAALRGRDWSNRWGAGLQPAFANYFQEPFQQLERARRVLEDRLFANDTADLLADYNRLLGGYQQLLNQYQAFLEAYTRLGEQLILGPYFFSYSLDNWTIDWQRGESAVQDRDAFVSACTEYAQAFHELQVVADSNYLSEGFQANHLDRMRNLSDRMDQAQKRLSGFMVSPAAHYDVVKLDKSFSDAENLARGLMLLQSPLIEARFRIELRKQILADAVSVSSTRNAPLVADADRVDVAASTLAELSRLPFLASWVQTRDPQPLDEVTQAARTKILGSGAGLVVPAPTLLEFAPQATQLRDAEFIRSCHHQTAYHQLCLDRAVRDFWGTPRGDGGGTGDAYFNRQAEVVRKRDVAFRRVEWSGIKVADQVQALDEDEWQQAQRFADNFGNVWQFTEVERTSQDPNVQVGLPADVPRPIDLEQSVLAWVHAGGSKQAKAFASWVSDPLNERRTDRDVRLAISLRGHTRSFAIPALVQVGPKPVALKAASVEHVIREIPPARIRVIRENPPVRAHIVLVLDCSKSMNDEIAQGIQVEGSGVDSRVKRIIALESMREFISQIAGENSYRLQLLAFGASYEYELREVGGKRGITNDSRPLLENKSIRNGWGPVEGTEARPEVNLDQLEIPASGSRVTLTNEKAFLDSLGALDFVGQTPLFFSMERALDQFSSAFAEEPEAATRKILIVISDGVDWTYSNRGQIENSLAANGRQAVGRLAERIRETQATVYYFNFGSDVGAADGSGDFPNEVRSLGRDQVRDKLALIDDLESRLNADASKRVFYQTNLRRQSLKQFLYDIVAPPTVRVTTDQRRIGDFRFQPYRAGQSELAYPANKNALLMDSEYFGEQATLTPQQAGEVLPLTTNQAERIPLYAGLNLRFALDETSRKLTARFSSGEAAVNRQIFEAYSEVHPSQKVAVLASDIGNLRAQFWNPQSITTPPHFAVLAITSQQTGQTLYVPDYEIRTGPDENSVEFAFSRLNELTRKTFKMQGTVECGLYVFEQPLSNLWEETIGGQDLRGGRYELELAREFMVNVTAQRRTNDVEVRFAIQPKEGTRFAPEQVVVLPILPSGNPDYDALLRVNSNTPSVTRVYSVDPEGVVAKTELTFVIPEARVFQDPNFRFGLFRIRPDEPEKLGSRPTTYRVKREIDGR